MDNKKSPIGRVRWTILAMLLCATTINYMDRVALAQLKPIFEVELKWTEADYAKIVFSFQLAYAIGLAVVGRFMDWAGTRKGLAIIIGLGEVGCVITSSTLIAQESPVRIRGAVVGFFSACGAIGILIASKVGGQLFDVWSPTGPFVLFGFFAFVVALCGIGLRLFGDSSPSAEQV